MNINFYNKKGRTRITESVFDINIFVSFSSVFHTKFHILVARSQWEFSTTSTKKSALFLKTFPNETFSKDRVATKVIYTNNFLF
jgi:hypothetical protein